METALNGTLASRTQHSQGDWRTYAEFRCRSAAFQRQRLGRMSPAPFCATFIQQNVKLFAAVDPAHNSLVDSPYDVQNRQAEQLILHKQTFPSIQVLKPAKSPVWPLPLLAQGVIDFSSVSLWVIPRRYQRSVVLSLLQSNFVLAQRQ